MTEQNPPISSEIKFHMVRKIECHKIVGLAGLELLEHEAKYLEFHRIAGVILFGTNVESFSQVRDLVESVQERMSGDGLVPIVAVDHEGDFVGELKKLIGIPPSAMAIAATGDPELAYDVALETGQAMAKLGVNAVFAPVADLFLDRSSPVTGIRTFGRDPEIVGEFVASTIRGFREAGVLTCVKHFPGHGGSGGDSHETLPVINKTMEELQAVDYVPFRRAIEAGTDMVMTAHVAYTLGDEAAAKIPASFDPKFLQNALRAELGFEGVIITDALEMEGARVHSREKYGGLMGGAERSLVAGSDILLYAAPIPVRIEGTGDENPMIAVEVMQTIIETLHKVVDPSRVAQKLEKAAENHEGVRNLLKILDASEARIVKMRKSASQLNTARTPKPGGNVISLGDFASTPPIYKTVAERSIVLLRDPESFIPLGKDSVCLLLPVEYVPGQSLKRQDLDVFLGGLCRMFPSWKFVRPVVGFDRDENDAVRPVFAPPSVSTAPVDGEDSHPVRSPELPDDALIVPVFSSRGVPPDPFLDRLAEFVEDRHVPFVIVTAWPVTSWIPESVGCLVTLGASGPVAAAAGAVLAGETAAREAPEGIV
ncbi:MAG: hypothetical protein O7D32_09110 [bacterium]|nr:hypothetical protein [bacterium]